MLNEPKHEQMNDDISELLSEISDEKINEIKDEIIARSASITLNISLFIEKRLIDNAKQVIHLQCQYLIKKIQQKLSDDFKKCEKWCSNQIQNEKEISKLSIISNLHNSMVHFNPSNKLKPDQYFIGNLKYENQLSIHKRLVYYDLIQNLIIEREINYTVN
jgi:dephospho-CoA kinase